MAVLTDTVRSDDIPAVVVEEQLFCSLTGRKISAAEAYWAPPLVTASELVSMTIRMLFQSPGLLGQMLMAEQPNVPYAPEARELLAKRRSSEQMKLLLLMLVIMALIIAPIMWLSLR